MPNYVTNRIEISATGQTLEDILTAIQRPGDVRGSFDFNRLIPMPEALNITEGSITDQSISAFLSHLKDEIQEHPDLPGKAEDIKRYLSAAAEVKKHSFLTSYEYMPAEEIAAKAEKSNMSVEDYLELGKKYLDNQLSYGYATWYRFCSDKWGTKWNADSGCLLDADGNLRFDTAWAAPEPIMKALSEKFPTVSFQHAWADEDLGHNVGRATYRNGHVIDYYLPEPGSAQAYELAFDILQTSPEAQSLRFDPKTSSYVYDESMEEGLHTQEVLPIDNKIDLAKIKAALCSENKTEPIQPENPER